MITINEAAAIILEKKLQLSTESISIHEAHERVLAEDLMADSDLPPFDRVMMDGIAIAHASLQAHQHSFPIAGIQRAGAEAFELPSPTQCIEVMTGSVLPLNADTVIPYEEIEIKDGIAHLKSTDFKLGQNVHPRGSDFKKGDLLAHKGIAINSAIVGIAASIGKSTLLVERLPRIAIVSTGDELVPIDAQPLPHQIRRSNAHALAALVNSLGWKADLFHFNDNEEAVSEGLDAVLHQYDVLLLSGGVSKGKFDLLPQLLSEKEVMRHFHFVQQKPGKPFWFGSKNNTLVFAFPGNPVSTLVCAHRYFVPWAFLQKAHRSSPVQWVTLGQDIETKGSLEHLVTVRLEQALGQMPTAHKVEGHGSGDFAHLATAHGFVQVRSTKKGTIVPFFPLL